eukprot:COSAG06_NODE_3396_length_5405_cov_6.327554_7_plen_474_part_01
MLTVHINVVSWGSEISWNIDNGQTFSGFADNNDYYESLPMSPGDHTINFIDSYGDGWHGGYWEILPGDVDASTAVGVTPLAGGPTDGQVSGYGGSMVFYLPPDNGPSTGNTSTCANDPNWAAAGQPTWTCPTYATGSANENYCDDVSPSGVTASIACPVACETCATGEDSPSDTEPIVTPAGTVPITVHIHTLTWANEISWNIDNGQTFSGFADNNDYYEVVSLPSGDHTINFIDSYGDGWHGGYWEILPGDVDASTAVGVTPLAGGPTDGQVSGYGGELTFTLSDDGGTSDTEPIVTPAGTVPITVQVTTTTWGNEISWNVDGGTSFGPFADHSIDEQTLELPIGDHTLYYFDSYGDGWHGGYWTLINPVDGSILAGGPQDGLVTGAGGETPFTLGEDGSAAVDVSDQIDLTVHIHTLTWANEISWNIDNGQTFSGFADNSDYYEVVSLPSGDHTINFIDSYGDGWHGGYWEI